MNHIFTKIVKATLVFALVFSFSVAITSAQTTNPVAVPSTCLTLTHDMKLNTTDSTAGGDVALLQKYLVATGYLDISKTVNGYGYYGGWTNGAVTKWQKAQGFQFGSGFGSFGPTSREQLRKITCTTATTSPVVSVVGTPTLTLTLNGKEEVSLVSNYKVSVIAPSGHDLSFSKSNPFSIVVNGNDYFIPGTNDIISTSTFGAATDMNGQPLYVVYAGKRAEFTIKTSYPLKVLFAGNYSSYLSGLNVFENNKYTPFIDVSGTKKTNSVTIIGETSPYITSAGIQEGKGGDEFVVKGARLKGADIIIDASPFTATGRVDADNGTEIRFPVITSWSNGQHSVVLSNKNGKSNAVSFQAFGTTPPPATTTPPVVVTPPTVSVVGTPTLALSYDFTQKESGLVATFSIKVTAGNQAFNIYGNPFSFEANSSQSTTKDIGNTVYYNGGSDEVNTMCGGSCHIAASSSKTFTVRAYFVPSRMFAGNYTVSLSGVQGTYSDTNTGIKVFAGSNKTNAVAIVGETSPYIASVTSSIKPKETLTISGLKLTGAEVLIDNVVTKPLGITESKDGTKTYFTPPVLTVGAHVIQLKNANGLSNTASFNVIPAGVAASVIQAFEDLLGLFLK